MNPATAKKLKENIPEIVEFMVYLKSQVRTLNGIHTIKSETTELIAVEIAARKMAMEIMTEILKPLIDVDDITGNDPNEYTVNVE
jgi:hypothetical protein